MKLVEAVDLALKNAGLPVKGVSIINDMDKRTWRVDYDNATPEQEAAGAALIQAFNPFAPEVAERAKERAAEAFLDQPFIPVLYLWICRELPNIVKLNGADPSSEERDAAIARLVQAFKDAAGA